MSLWLKPRRSPVGRCHELSRPASAARVRLAAARGQAGDARTHVEGALCAARLKSHHSFARGGATLGSTPSLGTEDAMSPFPTSRRGSAVLATLRHGRRHVDRLAWRPGAARAERSVCPVAGVLVSLREGGLVLSQTERVCTQAGRALGLRPAPRVHSARSVAPLSRPAFRLPTLHRRKRKEQHR